MNSVEVDVRDRIARLGAGALWGDVLDACAGYGLAPLGMASVASVGVAGYLLGGGMGPLGRREGFGADHVVAVKFVDAEGRQRTSDAEHDSDLFWAFRGGRFVPGVATAFTVRLAPAPQLFAASLTYARADVPAATAAFAEWQRDFDAQSTCIANLMRFSDAPQLPESLRGRRFLQIDLVHAGDDTSGRAVLDRLTAATAPETSHARQTDPATWLRGQLPPPPGPTLQLGMLVNTFSPEVARELVDVAGPEADAPWRVVEIRPFGGRLGRRADPDNSVGGRTDGVLVSGVAAAPDGFDGLYEAFDALRSRLGRWYVPGVNVAFHGPDSPRAPVCDAWPPDVWARLTAIRAAHDPHGVFPAPAA